MSEPSKRLQIASWCLFDFANSSFTTVVITGVYNLYFVNEIAPDGGARLWSLALFVSNLAIILSAPVVGAVADRMSGKKRFLLASYFVCVAATAALFFVTPGMVLTAMAVFVVANVAFASGENLVAGFLPELAEPEEIGRVSSWGWGVGYIGGLLALGLCYPLAKSGDDTSIRATNLVVAAFFLVGGLPTFLFVRERVRTASMRLAAAVRAGMREAAATWRDRASLPDLFAFLLAHLVFSVGVYGVIGNAAIYGGKLCGLAGNDVIVILMASQITAVAGALATGPMIRRLGYVRTVRAALVVWIVAGVTIVLSHSPAAFTAVALLAGAAMGATLSSARAAVGYFTPDGRSGEVFGFWGLFGRVAAVVMAGGHFVILWVTRALTGRERLEAGVVFFVLTFCAGLALLSRVDERRGRETAARG